MVVCVLVSVILMEGGLSPRVRIISGRLSVFAPLT